MTTGAYYGKTGSYLKEHATYFTEEKLKRDTDFIIMSLVLTKKDKCLDLQCAQGRLTIEMRKKGYDMDGVDLSDHMLELAKKSAARENLDVHFIKDNLNNLCLPKIYTKIAMYFPDWEGVKLDAVLLGVSKAMKRGGLFLYDQDNLFRIWNYLIQNPKAPFTFDSFKMELVDKGKKSGNRYYIFPELVEKFEKAGFKIIRTYGGWSISDGPYRYNSPRLRIVAKKT